MNALLPTLAFETYMARGVQAQRRIAVSLSDPLVKDPMPSMKENMESATVPATCKKLTSRNQPMENVFLDDMALLFEMSRAR